MSAEVDVREMRVLCEQIADYFAVSKYEKSRVEAVMRQVGVSANRAYEFLKGKARRIDSFEMDAAREAKAQIQEAKYAEHLQWLRSEIEHHRSSGDAGGKALRGPHVDALEHFLRSAGYDAGAVEVPED